MEDNEDHGNNNLVMLDDHDNDNLLTTYSFYKTLIAVVGSLTVDLPRSRNPTLGAQKLIWDEYVNQFSNHPTFIKRHLRMSLESFFKLLGYFRTDLEGVPGKGGKAGPILPEISLFCALRWLAGGSYLDIFALTGISVASFYRVCYKVFILIDECPELALKLPTNAEQCVEVSDGFRSISYKEAITNCIGAVDGYLLRTITPIRKQAGNVKSFYSGHYQCPGMNIQAVCDHHSRFLFFCISGPGSMNDREAIKESGLLDDIRNLPEPYVIIADAAYEATEQVVPVFYGISRQDTECDNFNYFASQCRIRIEMAFGLMQMKWGILWRPMRVHLDNVKYIMHAISRLHNFTINERLLNDDPPDEVGTGINRLYHPTDADIEEYDDEATAARIAATKKHLKGMSIIRDNMVQRVKTLGISRPKSNQIRKDDD